MQFHDSHIGRQLTWKHLISWMLLSNKRREKTSIICYKNKAVIHKNHEEIPSRLITTNSMLVASIVNERHIEKNIYLRPF